MQKIMKKISICLIMVIVITTTYLGNVYAYNSQPKLTFAQELQNYYNKNGKFAGFSYNHYTYTSDKLSELITYIESQIDILGSQGQGSKDPVKARDYRILSELLPMAQDENPKYENTTEDDFAKFTFEEIVNYMETSWPSGTAFPLSEDIRTAWNKTLEKGCSRGDLNAKKKQYIKRLYNNNNNDLYDNWDDVYEETPGMEGTIGNSDASANHTPDEIINEAQNFINAGNRPTIGGQNLQQASSTLYNILLSIGIFVAVAVGVYLGVKFMLASAEDKAKVKESLIPYIAGCVVIFSAFIIWRLAITLLSGIK